MSDAPKTSISAKIPSQLHEKLIEAVNDKKFIDKTDCITQALEKILCNTHQSPSFFESVIQEKDNEIQRITHDLRNISTQKTPPELIELQAQQEVIRELLDEKDKRITDLNREIEDLRIFAHYFKSTEHKQIEATANIIQRNTGLITKTCKNCGKEFETGNNRKETCSDYCRYQFSKKKK